jgi:hypothetical protein
VAAATTVFNAFVEHARGRDGCPPLQSTAAELDAARDIRRYARLC